MIRVYDCTLIQDLRDKNPKFLGSLVPWRDVRHCERDSAGTHTHTHTERDMLVHDDDDDDDDDCGG